MASSEKPRDYRDARGCSPSANGLSPEEAIRRVWEKEPPMASSETDSASTRPHEIRVGILEQRILDLIASIHEEGNTTMGSPEEIFDLALVKRAIEKHPDLVRELLSSPTGQSTQDPFAPHLSQVEDAQVFFLQADSIAAYNAHVDILLAYLAALRSPLTNEPTMDTALEAVRQLKR